MNILKSNMVNTCLCDNNRWRLCLAIATIPVALGGYSWMLMSKYIANGGLYGIGFIAIQQYTEIFSFIAPPNPHLMNDRQFSYVVCKFLMSLFGANAISWNASLITMHVMSCFLLYRIAILIYKNKECGQIAALLFFVAPSSIFNISSSSVEEVLCLLFMLLAIYFHILWVKNKSILLMLISLFAFYLAMRSKEYGFVTIIIIFMYQLIESINYRTKSVSIPNIIKPARIIMRALWPFATVILFDMFVTSNGIVYAIQHFHLFLNESRVGINSGYVQNFDLYSIIDRLSWYGGLIMGVTDYYLPIEMIMNIGILYFTMMVIFLIPLVVAIWAHNKWLMFAFISMIVTLLPILPLPHPTINYIYVSSAFLFLGVAGIFSVFASWSHHRLIMLRLCQAAIVSAALVEVYAGPQFRQTKELTLYNHLLDKSFLEYIKNNYMTLPEDTFMYIDGIDAPLDLAQSFPRGNYGNAESLDFIYHESPPHWVSGATHEEILESYRKAPAPKVMIRLYFNSQDAGLLACRASLEKCTDTALAAAVWREVGHDYRESSRAP